MLVPHLILVLYICGLRAWSFFCCSVAKSCPTLWDPMNFSTLGFSVLRSLPEFAQTHESVMPSNHLILIGESVMPSNHLILIGPFSSCPQSFPATRSFSISWLFASGDQSIGVSASVLPMNIQGWLPLGLTAWSPCRPRDSQGSSPTPQFKSINSSALSLLYGPSLTDYWTNHSFDYRDVCRQIDVSAFQYTA